MKNTIEDFKIGDIVSPTSNKNVSYEITGIDKETGKIICRLTKSTLLEYSPHELEKKSVGEYSRGG